MNFRIKDPKQVVLHASGESGAGFIDGVWHGQPQKKEWVGLTGDEARKFYEKYTDREELIYAIDKFLDEKNA